MVFPEVEIKDIVDVTSSKRIFLSDYVEEGIPFYRGKEIILKNQNKVLKEFLYITENKYTEIKQKYGVPVKGDILITAVGTLGIPYLVKENEIFYFKDGNCIWLKNPMTDLSNQFLYYFFLTDKFKGVLKSIEIGASQKAITINDFKKIKVPNPDENVKEIIVYILSSYDNLIFNNIRRIELLEKSAELLYNEWFVNMRFPGYKKTEIKNGVPNGWQMLTLYDIMTVNSGGTPKTNKVEYWDGEIPFYTPKDYNDHFYVLKTEKAITDLGLRKCNSKLYGKNTVFISARGTVGAITLNQKPMAMNQTNYALIGKEGISQFFLFCVMRNKIKHLKSTASGAVFDAIVVDTFKLIPFVLPRKDIIQKFTEIVTPMFNQIEKLLLINENLTKARDLLLPKLLNGEIEV